jgi:hypothetical protein
MIKPLNISIEFVCRQFVVQPLLSWDFQKTESEQSADNNCLKIVNILTKFLGEW